MSLLRRLFDWLTRCMAGDPDCKHGKLCDDCIRRSAVKHTPITAASPATLAQRLRYIDLTFECVRRATAICRRVYPDDDCWPRDGEPSIRSRRIGRMASRLRERAVIREGLPLSLLGQSADSMAQAHRSEATLAAHDAAPPRVWPATIHVVPPMLGQTRFRRASRPADIGEMA